jgi:anti-sigma28 factor (negative regulator of flagellin synthesis)
MAMKARMQRTDASILLAHACPGRMEQRDVRADDIARVKVQIAACYASFARYTWIKMLKAQVDAGRYIVDSRAIAEKMHSLPAVRALLKYEINDISLSIQEDEPQE